MSPARRPAAPAPHEDVREERQSLVLLVIGPSIWAVHFLACYVSAAIWCEKVAGRDGPLGALRLLIGTYTLVAMAGIALNARAGWRRHRFGSSVLPHDFDTPEDRLRFLGFAAFLLACLSAVAVIFVALVALFFEDCL